MLTPPMDLKRLATCLGVRTIRVVPLAMRGRVLVEGASTVVEVNEDLEAWDKQHTIAHELAHLVLERARMEMARKVGENVPRTESTSLIEELCELCADEILLPTEWLRSELAALSPSLEVAVDVANRAAVPVDYLVERCISLGLQPWRAIWFERRDGQVFLKKSAPSWTPSLLASTEVVKVEQSPILGCLRDARVARGRVVLRIRDEEVPYRAECRQMLDGSVLCILWLR